jgi:hypothetical protein
MERTHFCCFNDVTVGSAAARTMGVGGLGGWFFKQAPPPDTIAWLSSLIPLHCVVVPRKVSRYQVQKKVLGHPCIS